MIRMIQRRLIIPRGDTGSFSIPYLKAINPGDVAVFTIFDIRTKTKMYQKLIAAEGDILNIAFSHSDTVNLKPGKYLWDIKFYTNPQFVDDELVNGDEIDSYYAGFTLPECEIRETGDTLLMSNDSPATLLAPSQIDIITNALNEIARNVEKTETNVSHYPKIEGKRWYVWDATIGEYIDTGLDAGGILPDTNQYMLYSDMQALTNEEIDTILDEGG